MYQTSGLAKDQKCEMGFGIRFVHLVLLCCCYHCCRPLLGSSAPISVIVRLLEEMVPGIFTGPCCHQFLVTGLVGANLYMHSLRRL